MTALDTQHAADPLSAGANVICGTTIHGSLRVQGSADGSPWNIGSGGANSVQGCVTIPGETDVPGTVGRTVAATLALTLGAAPTFGEFTPGVEKTYTTTSSADVISTTGRQPDHTSGPPPPAGRRR